MGRRNIFTYLGRDSEKVNNRIKKYMKFIEAHNDAPFEDRGEWIDCIDKIVYTDGNKSVSWLVFSSAGGDWATLEFFKDKFYGFYDRLKNLEQFEGYRTYNKKYYENPKWVCENIKTETSIDLINSIKRCFDPENIRKKEEEELKILENLKKEAEEARKNLDATEQRIFKMKSIKFEESEDKSIVDYFFQNRI